MIHTKETLNPMDTIFDWCVDLLEYLALRIDMN
jgi:hypothetical protein